MIQFRLDGQTAVVTGASRGIGRAVALALGQAGAKVIGTATTDEGAAAISEALRPTGEQLLWIIGIAGFFLAATGAQDLGWLNR